MSKAELLREARQEFGWTLEQAADFAGVGLRTWQTWETEVGTTKREPPPMLFRLLELYRQLRELGIEHVSWERLNEEAARRSKSGLLRPNRATYGAGES